MKMKNTAKENTETVIITNEKMEATIPLIQTSPMKSVQTSVIPTKLEFAQIQAQKAEDLSKK